MPTPRVRDAATLMREALSDLPRPVTLRWYTPDLPGAHAAAEGAFLDALAAASPQVRLDVLADRWDAAREEAAGIRRTPVIAVAGEHDPGLHFYGTPDGYELETFLGLLRALSEGRTGLTTETEARLAGLMIPLHLEILASPT